MRVKTSNGKFFIGIGILLVIAGIVIFPDDDIIGVIAVLIGSYNVVKGIRLLRGIQPLLIRKQQERQKELDNEVRDQIDESKKTNN